MKEDNLIEIKNAVPRIEAIALTHPVNWTIKESQHWAVIGPNGGGKSLLIDILLAKRALKSGEIICKDDRAVNTFVKHVAFSDIYRLIDVNQGYYQQRWNTGDNLNTPFVKDLFVNADKEWVDTLIQVFSIRTLIEKRLNMLSSGELRKTLIVLSLLSKPLVLIIDNPYIGLDTKSRTVLDEVLKQLTKLEKLQIILVVSRPEDVPPVITNILPVRDRKIGPEYTREKFYEEVHLAKRLFARDDLEKELLLPSQRKSDFENALIFKHVHVKYDSHTILNDVNWQVKRGEKWLLWGDNGSGKSTLLSLIYGDNPQAYANDITLFDQKRGSGESIWDIKKRVGYISPEMAIYYKRDMSCMDIVRSGFFDTLAVQRKCTDEQDDIVIRCMRIFRVAELKDTSFLKISAGEQQLVFLARLFVKDPDLLVLDEPLHSLDADNKRYVNRIIERYCTADKTMIYVTHYENEIPGIITHRLELTKKETSIV